MSGRFIITAKIVTLLLVVIFSGCQPEAVSFSNIPEIELRSVTQVKDVDGKDSVITLELKYQDGDGDIGLTEADTAAPFNFGSPFYHNLPVTYMVENSNGEYEELLKPGTDIPYGNQHERIPNLTPPGKYKAIEGVLEIDLLANPENTRPKRLKLEIKMMDRSLNISNTLKTPLIELKH